MRKEMHGRRRMPPKRPQEKKKRQKRMQIPEPRLRDAAKHYFYAVSHSVLINGLTPETEIESFIPWWQPALIVLDVAVGLVTVGFGVLFALSAYRRKKEA